MFTKWRNFKNPDTFLGRFIAHFALGYSACLVVMVIAHLTGQLDMAMGAIWSLLFSAVFGLLRAKLTSPGTLFWGSPFEPAQDS